MTDMLTLLAQEPTAPTVVLQQTSWLSPEGIGCILFVITTILSVISALLQRAGKKEAAEKLGVAQKVLGVVVRGVEKGKGKVGRDAATTIIRAIQEESLAHGTEDLLAPIVTEVQANPTAPPDAPVRTGTARYEASRTPTPPGGTRRVS